MESTVYTMYIYNESSCPGLCWGSLELFLMCCECSLVEFLDLDIFLRRVFCFSFTDIHLIWTCGWCLDRSSDFQFAALVVRSQRADDSLGKSSHIAVLMTWVQMWFVLRPPPVHTLINICAHMHKDINRCMLNTKRSDIGQICSALVFTWLPFC